MADSPKKDRPSVSMKEKDTLLDLDIEKDIFSSWKPMADGDIDFDLTPVSKGNKKSFDFGKADMDFNLDGDFGKISSFNMDMSDLEISPPLKKDGKSKEKPKESCNEKDKGKADRFAFAFDFDELENFNFDSSFTKEVSKAQSDKNKKESSSTGSGLQDKESSMHMNLTESKSGFQDKESSMHMDLTGSKNTLEDGPQKPSLPGNKITFDENCQVGESAELEPTGKNCPQNIALDDDITSEHSGTIDEIGSDIEKSPPETTIASKKLSKTSNSEKLVLPETVDLEACTKNDDMQDLSSDSLSQNEPSGGNPSESQDKVDSLNTNAMESNGEQNVNETSISGSTFNYKHTISDSSRHLRTVEATEERNGEKSQVGVEDHGIDDRERTELGQVNPLAETSSTSSAASGILSDAPSGRENRKLASEIQKVPLVSQLADLSNKETENGREPLLTCSRSSIQSEKPECPAEKVLTQATFSSLSSKKIGSAQSSLVEGRNSGSIQSDRKLVSLPLQYSKTPLRRELPQLQRQESCKALKISGEACSAGGLQNGKKLIDASTTKNEEMVKTNSALRQREMSMKDLNTLSKEINNKAAGNSGNPTTLASIPITKNTTAEEHKLSLIEGVKKIPDLPGLKLSGLKLDATKFSIQKDIKSAGNIDQNKVLFSAPSSIAHFPDSHKPIPSTLSMKRKTSEEDTAAIVALHPSKRLLQSSNSRNFVETSEKVLDKKVPSHQKNMEDNRIKTTIGNSQVSTVVHKSHEVQIKEVGISSLVENDSNIKQAEAYSKELDDLCNMLRKKHDESKEILVKAIVNSNKLLMLNSPLLEEKVNTEQHFLMKPSKRELIFHMKVKLLPEFSLQSDGTESAFRGCLVKDVSILTMVMVKNIIITSVSSASYNQFILRYLVV